MIRLCLCAGCLGVMQIRSVILIYMDCQEYKNHVKSRKRFVLWHAVIPKEIPVKISGRQERAYYLWRDGIVGSTN